MNSKYHPSDLVRYAQTIKLILGGPEKIIVDLGGGLYPISKGIISKKTLIVDGNKKFNPDILTDLDGPLPFKKEFADIVIAGEILEHLNNPFNFLLEIKRILKPKGELVLTTPNTVDLKSRIKVLFGVLPTNCAKAFPTRKKQNYFHKTDYNWRSLRKLITLAGLKIVKAGSNGVFFGKKQIVPPSLCPLTLGEKFIIKAIK